MLSKRRVLCALDTGDLDEATGHVRRLGGLVGGFKIGHALTLQHGLEVVSRLRDAGAERIFLDLKFHDIPNVVGLAVCEAAKRGVWMMTVHISGGPAMMQAAMEEAGDFPEDRRPLLVGVSVLTSISEETLHRELGVQRSLVEHMTALSRNAMASDLDGVVCGPHEVAPLREALGRKAVLVVPGIQPPGGANPDQQRSGDAGQAIRDGADYLVIGRALTRSPEPERLLEAMG